MKPQQLSNTEVLELSDSACASPLHDVIDATTRPNTEKRDPVDKHDYSGVWLYRLVGFHQGSPQIDMPEYSSVISVYAVACQLELADVGSILAVVFDKQCIERPIVLGKVQSNLDLLKDTSSNINISAENEISFRCGKASINLKADGTVAIRGSNVISRASHTNRIRGGNVQIN